MKYLAIALAACVLLAGCTEKPDPAKMEQAASAASPVIGKVAPPFSLQDQSDQTISLSDLGGKWVVLYFYPKDDTPGCACQATEFTQLLTEFRNMDAAILGVSPDSPASHRRFIDKYKLGLRLLSDPDRKMMRDYGAWVDTALGGEQYGRVVRSTYIIGPDGVIRWHWPEVIPEGHAERVADRLAELQRGG